MTSAPLGSDLENIAKRLQDVSIASCSPGDDPQEELTQIFTQNVHSIEEAKENIPSRPQTPAPALRPQKPPRIRRKIFRNRPLGRDQDHKERKIEALVFQAIQRLESEASDCPSQFIRLKICPPRI